MMTIGSGVFSRLLAPTPRPAGGPGNAAPLAVEVANSRARSTRVIGLTVAIILLSVADLYITLMYFRSVGMSEANPIARWIMTGSSTGFLIWWKLLSVGIASTIFLVARRFRSAELAAWGCCLLLVWLTVRWSAYSQEVVKLTPVIDQLAQADSHRWIISTN